LPAHFQHFLVGVLVTVFFPLLPLGAELKYSGTLEVPSLYIASIMYISAISFAYENILIFICGIVISIYLALDYGSILLNNDPSSSTTILPATLVIIFGIVQTAKCYNLHIGQKENFLYFPKVST